MKYRVLLSQTVIESAYVEVEADDERSAERKAIDLAYKDGPSIVWEFTDVADDGIEALDVTEVQEA